jgi:hypothetical protein
MLQQVSWNGKKFLIPRPVNLPVGGGLHTLKNGGHVGDRCARSPLPSTNTVVWHPLEDEEREALCKRRGRFERPATGARR